ncbi:MAG TPA: hypothetical protein VGF86_05640 [Candidatus Tumulicola sp.]|jgi:hypothetical protein
MIKSWIPAAVCAAAFATGCSSGSGSSAATQAPSSPAAVSQDAQGAQGAGDDAATSASSLPSGTASPQAVASTTGTDCSLVDRPVVEQAMHLSVQSVDVASDKCTFHFQGGDHGDLVVEYHASGGRDELDSVRKAGEGAKAIFGGITKAASAPPGMMGVLSATPPPDVTKVGDDQVFLTEGPITQFYAIKGDAYVEVDGGFLPEGVSRWVVLPDVAQRVFATH